MKISMVLVFVLMGSSADGKQLTQTSVNHIEIGEFELRPKEKDIGSAERGDTVIHVLNDVNSLVFTSRSPVLKIVAGKMFGFRFAFEPARFTQPIEVRIRLTRPDPGSTEQKVLVTERHFAIDTVREKPIVNDGFKIVSADKVRAGNWIYTVFINGETVFEQRFVLLRDAVVTEPKSGR